MKRIVEISINQRQYLELEKIALGAFAPLSGFMNEDQFITVVNHMHLPDGSLFPLPVIFDLTDEQVDAVRGSSVVTLLHADDAVATLFPESVYTCEKESVAEKIFGTADIRHPGVAHFMRLGRFFVGGQVKLTKRVLWEFSEYELTPEQTRAHFKKKGWETVVGFQTRSAAECN